MPLNQPQLTIEVTISGRCHVLTLAGELDLVTVRELDVAVADACSQPPTIVVVDLRQLGFIDSSGLHALINAQDMCRSRGQDLRLIPGQPHIQRVVELAGMTDALELVEPEAALDHCES